MKTKTLAIFVLVFLVIALTLGSILYVQSNFKNSNQNSTIPQTQDEANVNGDKFSNSNETHWNHMPLTYDFYNLSLEKMDRVEQAMTYISNETNDSISFKRVYAVENNYTIVPDIWFIYVPFRTSETYDSLGYAYVNYTNNIVNYADIYLYQNYHCINQRPTIEIHEILHALGLQHVENNQSTWKDIMNPYASGCDMEITQQELNYLKSIYKK
jgi:predicted Zn-dependent protease